MKLNRLLEIVTILLNKKFVTAPELSDRFGVSVRTIYRDIEVLSSSGVPVYILFALSTLQSTKYPEVDIVLEKL